MHFRLLQPMAKVRRRRRQLRLLAPKANQMSNHQSLAPRGASERASWALHCNSLLRVSLFCFAHFGGQICARVGAAHVRQLIKLSLALDDKSGQASAGRAFMLAPAAPLLSASSANEINNELQRANANALCDSPGATFKFGAHKLGRSESTGERVSALPGRKHNGPHFAGRSASSGAGALLLPFGWPSIQRVRRRPGNMFTDNEDSIRPPTINLEWPRLRANNNGAPHGSRPSGRVAGERPISSVGARQPGARRLAALLRWGARPLCA